jgi:hypothetical protein
VSSESFEASLEVRKLYRVLPDRKAETQSLVRVVDESGEDYLCPGELFAPIDVTRETAAELSRS